MEFFKLPFAQMALTASLLAGNAIALIGLFVLMRRASFSALAVAQLAALGAVISIYFSHSAFFVVALLLVVCGLFLISRLERNRRVPLESWVGSLYVGGAAIVVLILSKAPLGESHTMNLFFGNILALGTEEILEGLFLLLISLACLGPWFHRWVWISFDPDSAEVAGVNVSLWNYLFYGLFAISMIIAIHLFGVLLAFSYLLLPSTIGLLITRNLKSLLLIIPITTSLLTLSGFYFSFQWDFPTGPFIGGFFVVGVFAAYVLQKIRN